MTIRLLDHLDSELPEVAGQQIVAISDNLSTRDTQEVTDWLEAHPRWSFQFTPTHASWLNQIEIFFSILYRRLLRHGAFTSEQDLAEPTTRPPSRSSGPTPARSSKHEQRISRMDH